MYKRQEVVGWNVWNKLNGFDEVELLDGALGTPNKGGSQSGDPIFDDYEGVEHSYAQTPPIDTSAGGTFRFETYVAHEDGPYDKKTVEVSTDDGLTWDPIYENSEFNSLPLRSWETIEISVAPGIGVPNTLFRFRYDTIDNCCGGPDADEIGWYLDLSLIHI